MTVLVEELPLRCVRGYCERAPPYSALNRDTASLRITGRLLTR